MRHASDLKLKKLFLVTEHYCYISVMKRIRVTCKMHGKNARDPNACQQKGICFPLASFLYLKCHTHIAARIYILIYHYYFEREHESNSLECLF